jgi:CheY-like chemotaxis protein
LATLLVVDDLAIHRTLVRGLLAHDPSYRVIFASNGNEALDKVSTEPVDLIITDLVMPGMNGLELLRALRRTHPSIPVVVMTASGSEEIAVRALEEGAASYVPKCGLGRKLSMTVDRVIAATDDQRLHSDVSRHITSQEFQLVLENNFSLLLGVPAYLMQHMPSGAQLDHVARLRVQMALEEALLNALYHGNLEVGLELVRKDADEFAKCAETRSRQAPFNTRRIFVRACATPEELLVVIRDEGHGFNSATLPDPTDLAHLDRENGRGIPLMRAFMDMVRFNDSGNEVTLIKRFNQTGADQQSTPS